MPDDRAHLVVGPEGSGTTLWCRTLAAHQSRGAVFHCSFPTSTTDARFWLPGESEPRKMESWASLFGDIVSVDGGRAKPGFNHMFIPDINKIDPTGRMVVWVCSRDRGCTTRSQLRNRLWKNNLSCERQSVFGRDVEFQRLHIEAQIEKRSGPVVFVPYETLMLWGRHCIRRLLAEAGMDHGAMDYNSVDLIDGNEKWLKMP